MGYKWLGRGLAYNGPHVTLVRNEKDYLSAMLHCKVLSPDEWLVGKFANATAHWLEHPTDGLCVIVALKATTQTLTAIYAILVHEAVHVVQAYFEHIGEHAPAKEQQAYAIQYVSQNLMEEYDRQVKPKAKRKPITKKATKT